MNAIADFSTGAALLTALCFVATIVAGAILVAVYREQKERAAFDARVRAANARYAASRAEQAAIAAQRALNPEAAILRDRMRHGGLTSLGAGEVLDIVEMSTPVDDDDEKLRRQVERDRQNRENFAAIDIATRPTFVVPYHHSTDHPSCPSSSLPSSSSGSDTSPSTSCDPVSGQ